MEPLAQTVFPQGRTWYTSRFNVHLDNYSVHFSKVKEQFFIENQLLHVRHQSHRSDLARRTSGYSGLPRLDSLAQASPSPRKY
jgi:hypothetical protein